MTQEGKEFFEDQAGKSDMVCWTDTLRSHGASPKEALEIVVGAMGKLGIRPLETIVFHQTEAQNNEQ